jgi:hypothetical protein
VLYVVCRLGREMKDLRGKQRLPVDASAAHFIRHDAERLDKVSVTACLLYTNISWRTLGRKIEYVYSSSTLHV